MTPETALEATLADSLRVCYAPSALNPGRYSMHVFNGGPAVWVVDDFPSWDATALASGPPAVLLFRNAIPSPDGLAIEPGQDAIAEVSGLYSPHIHLDPALQAQWEVASQTVAQGTRKLKTAFLNRRSPEFRAGVACAEAAYDVGQRLAPATGDGPNALETVFSGTTGTLQCRDAIEESRRAAAELERRPPQLAIEELKVEAIADRPVPVRENVLRAAIRHLKPLFKILPR
jgi:hypothetical protein